MLAGTFEPFDIRRAESVGYHSYLTKPFATSQLLALVRELIQAGVRPGTDDSQDGSGRARDPIPGQTAKKETGTVNKPLFSLTPQQCRPTPSFVNVADFQDFEEAVLTEPAGEPTTASEQPTASTAVPSINLSPEKIDLLVSRVMERLPGEIRRILSDALKDL